MDDFKLIHAILISLPEGIIMYLILFQLASIVTNKQRLAISTGFYIFSSLIIRNLYIPYGLNALINIILLTLFISIVFKRHVIISFLSMLTYAILSGIAEIISIPLSEYIMGITLNNAMYSAYLRAAFNIPVQMVLLIVFIVLHKNNISFAKWRLNTNIKKAYKIQRILSITIGFMLMQNFFIVLIFMCYRLSSRYNIFTDTIINIFPVLSLFLIIFSIALIEIIKRNIYVLDREAQYQLQSIMLDNIQEVISALRKERHNYINDLQVLYGLCIKGEDEGLRSYLKKMVVEVNRTSQYINIGSPAVSGLIMVKKEIAITKGIEWVEILNADLAILDVKVYDLCRVYGNLIQNSIEAAEECEKKMIMLKLYRDERGFIVLDIKNTYITDKIDMSDIIAFDEGVSTKGNGRGSGLYIAKEIVNSYKGYIDVSPGKDMIQFIIGLPY